MARKRLLTNHYLLLTTYCLLLTAHCTLARADALTLAERIAIKTTATIGPVEIVYELPDKSYVTLVVESKEGKRVRNLIADTLRPGGRNADYWDGADDEGRLVTPGEYAVRGLTHGLLDATYQLTFGMPGDPPWDSADGKGAWVSDHRLVESVAADDEQVYLAAPHAEAGSAVIAVDYEGRKQWGVHHVRFYSLSGVAVAVDDDYLYVLVDAWREPIKQTYHEKYRLVLYRVDKKTGDYVEFGREEVRHVGNSIHGAHLRDDNFFRVVHIYDRSLLPAPRLPEDWIATGDHNPDWARCNVLGMAHQDGMLYVSCYLEDKILVIDAHTGETKGELDVPSPRGVAVDSAGRLLAISGREVVVLDPAKGPIQTVVSQATGGLKAPVGLTADRRGNIFVSDWADQMCVKVFAADGSALRQVGKTGGRPWVGPWEENGMLLPTAMVVDGRDRLWVAERDFYPKRTSLWSAEGTFLREFIGGPFYKNVGTHVNPFDRTQALLTGCDIEIDWETGASKPVSTSWRATHPRALFGPNQHEHGSYRTIRMNGREFLISASRRVVISERKGDRYQPLAAVGSVGDYVHRAQYQVPNLIYRTDPRVHVPLMSEKMAPPEILEKIKDPERWEWRPEYKTNYYWADRNGDGLVQDDEISFFEFTPGDLGAVGWEFFFSSPVDEDLTIYPYTLVGTREYVWRCPVTGWTECGAPLYEPGQAEQVVNRALKHVRHQTSAASWVFSGGRILSTDAPMAMFDRNGETLWTYPNDFLSHGGWQAPAARPGLMVGVLYTLGQADLGGDVGTVFALRGNTGQDYLFTADGLYVASLFTDSRTGPDPYPSRAVRGASLKGVATSPSGESFGGNLFQDADTGKVYIMIGNRAPVICELTGLDTIRRLPRTDVQFTLDHYKEAERLIAQKTTEEEPRVFGLGLAKRAPTIDGNLDDWTWRDEAAEIFLDPHHQARAWAAYDSQNLYLGYDVSDSMVLANRGKDWTLLFKSGGAVDFRFGADPSAKPGRTKPVEGDQRIVIAPYRGEFVAVLYRYVVPGAADPQSFTSPVGTVTVDEVLILREANLAVKKGRDRYVLEAAVPLSALGLEPKSGELLRGDFGVIWSDATGRRNAARCYWANKAAGIVSDLPSETRMDPSQWGEFKIGE